MSHLGPGTGKLVSVRMSRRIQEDRVWAWVVSVVAIGVGMFIIE